MTKFNTDYNAMVKALGPYNVALAQTWHEDTTTPLADMPVQCVTGLQNTNNMHVTLREAHEYYLAHRDLERYNNLPGAIKGLTPIQVAGVAYMVEKLTGKTPDFNLQSTKDVKLLQKWVYLYCRSLTVPDTWEQAKSLLGKECITDAD